MVRGGRKCCRGGGSLWKEKGEGSKEEREKGRRPVGTEEIILIFRVRVIREGLDWGYKGGVGLGLGRNGP